MGSQSLAGTLERFLLLRSFKYYSILIVVFWALSPLGSQMTLRLVSLSDARTTTAQTVPYFRTIPNVNDQISLFEIYTADENITYEHLAAKTATMAISLGASLLGSDDNRISPMDQYGNVRIPQFGTQTPAGGWSDPPNPGQPTNWASFNGLMVSNMAFSNESNFIISTSYIDATCADPIKISYDSDATQMYRNIENAGFHQHAGVSVSGYSTKYAFEGSDGDHTNTILLDSNSFNPDEPVGFDDVTNETITLDDLRYFPAPVNLFYASKIRALDDHTFIDLLNCTLETIYLDANITCQGPQCMVTQMRPTTAPQQDITGGDLTGKMAFSLSQFANLLLFLPFSLGVSASAGSDSDELAPNALDQYLLGSPTPLIPSDKPYVKSYENITGDVFASRLTPILNTVWDSSNAPGSFASGASANFSSIPSQTTEATLTSIHLQAKYSVNRWHAALLITISFLLLICALASMVLAKITRAPDVLGYVSTMTRDNEFAGVPEGGTTLDGAQRTRLLGGLKVQLGDVRPEEEVGWIALRGMGGDGDRVGHRPGKNRLYR